MLSNDGHPRSNCPVEHRLKDTSIFTTGFIVRQNWAGKVTVVHNVNKTDALMMGKGGTASHTSAALARYAVTIGRLYEVANEGNRLVVKDRK